MAASSGQGPSPAAQADPVIPLCPGVSIVTAVSGKDGDYESIKTILANDAKGVRVRYSSEHIADDLLEGAKLVKVDTQRVLRTADLERATSYLQLFSADIQEVVPDTTSIGTSAHVLQSLNRGAPVEIGIFVPGFVGTQSLDRSITPNLYNYEIRAEISRVGAGRVTVPVLVDGQVTSLPAIQAAGDFFGEKAEFFFLDDARNPLTLKVRLGIGSVSEADAEMDRLRGGALKAGGDKDVLEVIKISTRCENAGASPAAGAGTGGAGGPGAGGAGAGAGGSGSAAGAPAARAEALEKALGGDGRADVYDIYFAFNSDVIRDESEPTLRAIAALLVRHADWKLAIEGHTDSIASDAVNLDLSRRRAAAVKAALVDRHRVAAARLTTNGFGESRPKDTNDTLKGRARNRRVELVRQ